MKIKLFLFALLLGGFAGSSDAGHKVSEAGRNTGAKTPEPKIDGFRIYKNYCVTCHRLYGDMGSVGAFDLTKTEIAVEEKIEVITHGRNTMAPFEGLLSPGQIVAVAEFTETLKR